MQGRRLSCRNCRQGGASTADLGFRLAAERTFLAWLRTCVSLMAFGFVVARFDWFLHRTASTSATTLGALLTATGGVLAALAALRFWRESREDRPRAPGPVLALGAGAAVTFAGVLLATYLLLHRLPV